MDSPYKYVLVLRVGDQSGGRDIPYSLYRWWICAWSDGLLTWMIDKVLRTRPRTIGWDVQEVEP